MSLLPEERFLPRGECGIWEPGWAEAAEAFNYGTAFCFMLIPIMMLYVIYRIRGSDELAGLANLHIKSLFTLALLFSLFTGFCGLHHYYEALAFSVPKYHKQTVIDGFMFVFSAATAVLFPILVLPFVRTLSKVIHYARQNSRTARSTE